jgi:hypothetical protein
LVLRPSSGAKPSESFESHVVPHCWGRAIKRTAGWVAITLGTALAILGVIAFDIGFGMTQSICSPWQSIGSLHVVAPIADATRFCERNPNHDIGLIVTFFGATLLAVCLFLVVVGGDAVFGMKL